MRTLDRYRPEADSETMMTKLTIAFLSGAVTVLACVLAAGGRASIITFALGVFLSAVALGAGLASRTRLRSAARFLSAFAQALDSKTARPVEIRKEQPEIGEPGSIGDLVYGGLLDLKTPKGQAKAATLEALKLHPAAEFDELFNHAVAIARQRRSA